MASFPCDACGLCCIAARCKHYNFNFKRCNIYTTRPLICNIEKGQQLAEKLLGVTMSQEEWYAMNAASCNELKRQKAARDAIKQKRKTPCQ